MSELVSASIIGSVGLLSKAFLNCFTRLTINNASTLINTIDNRPNGVPLITVSNHTSTVDDPLMFGILPPSILFNSKKMKWSLGAEELLFTNPLLAWFFTGGKVLAIKRGDGILQPNMNKAIELLNKGDWVHLFPEGRVIPDSSKLGSRLRWGIGRLLMESEQPPIILPIIHQGFENVKLFNGWIRLFSKVTITIGDPIDTAKLRLELQSNGLSKDEQRSQLALMVHSEMSKCYQPFF